MLDINRIRKEPEKVIELLSRRGRDFAVKLEEIREIDRKWRESLLKAEELRREINEESKEIGRLKREGREADPGKLEEMKEKSARLKELQDEKKFKKELDDLLLLLPNLPDEGLDHPEDRVIREEGGPVEFGFEPRTHWELGDMLKIISFKRAALLSGSRFALLEAEGAELERALINFMLDIHKEKHGYREIMPPYMVKYEVMEGTGQLPKFSEEMYSTTGDDENSRMYLIPTAEVPLANMHRGEILEKNDLPKKYVAYTPCFRKEAGSYGKDTSGLIRNHQFNKVELVNIVLPEESPGFHERLLGESEEILKQLGLKYRVVELGTGELGFSSSKTYDLEVWMPGEKMWREVSSCSNCGDFQARRMNTRFRNEDKKTGFVHTLNSSGLAVGRIFAAVLENYQTEELSIRVPEALCGYMKGKKTIERN
ncbi:MAG: serine--tRNA ligase [Elusimicrobia bacterium]|nr:serine--tRNA ligase [Elusimicrobiota bacterium]